MISTAGVMQAGDILIEELSITTIDNKKFELASTGYLGELNLFEDMWAQGLYGNLLIVDALNLSTILDLTGDEYLTIKIRTPSTNFLIYKTFKVYSITDRMFISDTGKQTFIMHFCSPEVFIDALSPVYKTYKKNKVHIHAKNVFESRLAISRTGSSTYTPMIIVNETDNDIQFTSPGWRPGKILNWLASKAHPKSSGKNSNPNYLFYESNKAYYFANIEGMIKTAVDSKKYYQDYFVMASNAADNSQDIDKQYKTVIDFKVITTYNNLTNTQNGYLANRLYSFDVVHKKRFVYDYDHVANWSNYAHLGKRPPFPAGSAQSSGNLRNPAGFNQVYMQHEQLYTDVKNNVGEQAGEILTRRTSAMAELNNFKIQITVPGRTDAEIGNVIYLNYPDASPKNLSDKALNKNDDMYSGLYLITAIRHVITSASHVMVLEIIKDSLDETRSA